ncbi:MAG: glycosyltransferase [Clostridia bacterium]|nr:glycosyltransferase [Clostridia bacterium]
MEKIKLLFIGITMRCGGSEKSFLSFVNCLDFDRFDVDLVLAKKDGLFMAQLPKQINVIEMGEFGEHFLLSNKNAVKCLFDTFIKKNIFYAFDILPYFLKAVLFRKSWSDTGGRLWVHMMQKMKPLDKKYDVAVAYWGDRTMFYMIDKVNADKKITWLHFDYAHPKRDNELYLKYFSQCDNIVNVSTAVDDALKGELPELGEKCLVIENINNPLLINQLADAGDGFPDPDYKGTRILTVGRIAEQKGYDFAVKAMSLLKKDGIDAKWYVLGDGDEDYKQYINSLIRENDVEDRFVFLGTTPNPYSYMKLCDIYAQPSRFEGKPISVEEAKILCKPMVVCNYLSAGEQLSDGKYGMICEMNGEGVYEGLKRMINEDGLCEKYRAELESHDFSNTAEIEKFYNII